MADTTGLNYSPIRPRRWVRGVGGLQEPEDRGMGTGLGWDWGGWVWYTLFQKSDKFL